MRRKIAALRKITIAGRLLTIAGDLIVVADGLLTIADHAIALQPHRVLINKTLTTTKRRGAIANGVIAAAAAVDTFRDCDPPRRPARQPTGSADEGALRIRPESNVAVSSALIDVAARLRRRRLWAQIVGQLEKLAFLRELGAPGWQLETVSANRRRQLAALARRSTTAALAGRPDRLRYPALLCFCHDQAVRLLDEILDRADQAVGEAHGQALRELRDLKAQTATAATRRSRCLTCSSGCCSTRMSPTTRYARVHGKRWHPSAGRPRASRPRRSSGRWMTTTTPSWTAAIRTCGASCPR